MGNKRTGGFYSPTKGGWRIRSINRASTCVANFIQSFATGMSLQVTNSSRSSKMLSGCCPTVLKRFISVRIHPVTSDGNELIWWSRKRCGKSEEAHAVMKHDPTGGGMPSGLFGVNVAWWLIMLLAFNLNSAMKHLVLGKRWINKRMKAIRFALSNLPGLVMYRSRQLVLRLNGCYTFNGLLIEAERG